ncbi:MAG: cofactor-independent phosphoglycerate mutase [Oscillospiraceae bacterium]|nr:cofactor-independent phosphoglycerate mutase [Oscillospiraceae bacterium]
MKYIVLLCDGMPDNKQKELDGMTPMEKAATPNMDMLADLGETGMVKTIPDGFEPGSDVGNLSVLGYELTSGYGGRAPLEAASIGVDLDSDDFAVRCNLVTLSGHEKLEDCVMLDYCAGDISTQEADELVKALQDEFNSDIFRFYCGKNYRHCLVFKCPSDRGNLGVFSPPHDIMDENIKKYLPDAPDAKPLTELIEKSRIVLKNHPVNLRRLKDGKRPANAIWLWGYGRKIPLIQFKEKYGLDAAMISAVDLLKGIAALVGMRIINVKGATGYIDTNYEGKANAALQALADGIDFVYIHIEAPDECGHRGEFANKVKSIENIDRRVLKLLLDGLKGQDFKIMITSDHTTPLNLRTHTSASVPFIIYESDKTGKIKTGNSVNFSEDTAKASGIFYDDAKKLIQRFIKTV